MTGSVASLGMACLAALVGWCVLAGPLAAWSGTSNSDMSDMSGMLLWMLMTEFPLVEQISSDMVSSSSSSQLPLWFRMVSQI